MNSLQNLKSLAENVEGTESLDLDSQSLSVQEDISDILKNERYSKDTKDRAYFARWTFVIISIWLITVVVLLSCNFLSQSVYITLLTTTTINIIGLPAIVLRGYFTGK